MQTIQIEKTKLPEYYNKITEFLNCTELFSQILPAGSTRLLLRDSINIKTHTKDIDLLCVTDYDTNQVLQQINNYLFLHHIEMVIIPDNFFNLISFKFPISINENILVDIFVIPNDLNEIKYYTELRFYNNENSETIKGLHRNILIESLLKSKGLILKNNGVYRYSTNCNINEINRFIINNFRGSFDISKYLYLENNTCFLNDFYFCEGEEYSKRLLLLEYFDLQKYDGYWLDIVNQCFNETYSLLDFDTFTDIIKLIRILISNKKLLTLQPLKQDFITKYFDRETYSHEVDTIINML